MTQFPYTPGGLPGGMSHPWIVVRPGSFRRLFAKPSGRQTFTAAHMALVAAAVLIYAPVRTLAHVGGPFAAAGFVAAIALLGGLVAWAMRVARVEWDGQQVVWYSGFARRVVGAPGVGQIVRASVSSSVNFGAIQYWIDAQGKVAGRFIEKQWDPTELGRIAQQARIPMVDLGEVTAAELSQRYPAIMPKLQAKLIRDSSSDANVFGIPAQQFTRVLAGGVLVVMVVAVIIRGLVA